MKHLADPAPKEEDPNFTKWDEEDSMIMVCLWSYMVLEISDTCMFMFLSTSKEIWDVVNETYSKAKDAAQVNEVKVKTMAAKQGNRTVTEYANQLEALWMELDHYRFIKTKCSANAARSLMLDTPIFENSSMLTVTDLNKGEGAAKSVDKRIGESTNMEKKGDEIWCTFCNKSRHTREKCWKLHGKLKIEIGNGDAKGFSQDKEDRLLLLLLAQQVKGINLLNLRISIKRKKKR